MFILVTFMFQNQVTLKSKLCKFIVSSYSFASTAVYTHIQMVEVITTGAIYVLKTPKYEYPVNFCSLYPIFPLFKWLTEQKGVVRECYYQNLSKIFNH